MLKHLKISKLALATITLLLLSSQAKAWEMNIDVFGEPLTLKETQEVGLEDIGVEEDNIRLEMRVDAMKEAALSYGAQSGMLHRNWEIYHVLMKREIVMDSVFNFSRLMIPSHYGTLIEPPIISESDNSFLLGDGGMTASLTSKIYSIGENAKIVSTPRNWRTYLMDYMDMDAIAKPDRVLRPRTKDERKIWDEYVNKGWKSGEEQANDIFGENLNRLVADFIGMIRYKKLLAQNMVSEPLAVKENRGVTGDGDEIRIDDKAVIITDIPALNRKTYKWEPTER